MTQCASDDVRPDVVGNPIQSRCAVLGALLARCAPIREPGRWAAEAGYEARREVRPRAIEFIKEFLTVSERDLGAFGLCCARADYRQTIIPARSRFDIGFDCGAARTGR